MKLFASVLIFCLVGSFMLSCVQKVCPAYESFFLLDSTAQAKKFTYFGDDTLPRQDMRVVNKSNFGIIDEGIETRIPALIRSPFVKLNMIEPEIIYPTLDDSLQFAGDALMLAELDVIDSTATVSADSTAGKIWHYNIEQENYFNYVRQRLNMKIGWVDASDLQEAMLAADSTQIAANLPNEADTTQKKGMFNKLFKKKEKKKETKEIEPDPVLEEDDPDDDSGF